MKPISSLLVLFFCLALQNFSFSQWACYPLGNGGQVVCGWACYSGHQGQDWQYIPNNSSYGQNVYAVYDGVVKYIQRGYTGCDDPFLAGGNDWNQPANFVIIEHTNGFYTRSFHVKDVVPGLIVGSTVKQGEVIAYIGNVGPISPCDNSNPNINAHLHFEVGTGWSGGISLTGRFDPTSIFTGCYPPFACGSTAITNANCTGGFGDSGGPNATYSNKEDYTFTIAPAGASSVSVNFYWIDIESGYDFLYAYDGPSTSAPLLGTFSGSSSPGTITAPSGSITFRFVSDADILGEGWSADWSCTTTPPPAPLSLSANGLGCPHDAVTLSWQNSGTGWMVQVSDDSTFSNYWHKDVSNLTSMVCPNKFEHSVNPGSYLALQPKKKYYWRIWDENVYTNGGSFITPQCLTVTASCSGLFEDTGGPSSPYTTHEDYTWLIQPPNASSVTMTFNSFDIEQGYDSLWIFDGLASNAPLLGVYTGSTNPGTVTANSGAMVLRFKSDYSIENAGWSANWSCLSVTGVEEDEEENVIAIFPNPSNGAFITNNPEGGSVMMEVYNITGKVVHQQELSNGLNSVKLNVNTGVYSVRISTATGIQSGNILIIEKP